ncbi:MAG: HAMP domain-containing protein, partial [Chloroflexus sp.]|nr:HAMP domain-containing protein [Chloroflexus sp.]
MMKWLHQLRWKLFVSHLIIVLMAYVVLLAAANVLVSLGWTSFAPLTLGSAAAETGQIHTGTTNEAVELQEQFQSVVQQALLISGFAALAAAVLVSLFVSRRIVEPIQTLSNVSRRLAQGLYRERIYLQADDEIAQLAQSVNQLAEALDQTERRRLALLADVTHELRTPLATIGGYMEGLVDGVVSANPATFNLILRETRRLQRLIEDLELLSRVEAGQLPVVARAIDLRSVLEAQISQFEPLFSSNHVTLSLDVPEQLPQVWADPDRVAQVLI